MAHDEASAESPRTVDLLGPVEIRALADDIGITPTKKLGQNFVHDANTVRRIVDTAKVRADDHVLEVGPGLGSLTLGLLEAAQHVTAIEIDERLAAKLPETVAARAGQRGDDFSLLNADALRVSPEQVAAASPENIAAPTALVANLPYNVAVPVLLHLLAQFPSISRVLVMVQAEVADRLAAQPGSKIYGVPSVKASFYGTVTRAGTIGEHVFWPAPTIKSGLVRIERNSDDDSPWSITEDTRRAVFPIVDAAFAQRRKTLRSALSKHYGSATQAEHALRAADIDPGLRGEKLSVADYVRLALGA
ncbi:16S rRNA (adenine(1518)-N(6)/adenine(1519)-N(6))-dimethyltransferase RsmA [Corynebacterium propinquum]